MIATPLACLSCLGQMPDAYCHGDCVSASPFFSHRVIAVTLSLVTPVLFHLAFHHWRARVLDLEPVRRAPRAPRAVR